MTATATYIGTRSGGSASGAGGLNQPYPTTLVAGDLLLLFVSSNRTSQIVRTSAFLADWKFLTECGTTLHTFVFWKVSDGTETGTFVVKGEVASNIESRIFQYRGTDPLYPIASFISTTGTTNSISVPTSKVKLDDSLAVLMVAVSNLTTFFTPPSGYTEQLDTNGVYSTFGMFDGPVSASVPMSGNIAVNNVTLFSLITITLNPNYANAAQVTPWYPAGATTNSGSGNIWSNSSNAAASDDARATIATSGAGNSNYDSRGLITSAHGISVPAGSRIIGVEVSVEGRLYSSLVAAVVQSHHTNFLVVGGTLQSNLVYQKNGERWTKVGNNSPTASVPADVTFKIGGPGSVFECDLTSDDVMNSGFGFMYVSTIPVYEAPSGSQQYNNEIDCLSMRVWYVPPNRLYPLAA